jgi:CheY-like chemotaxis protein
MNPARRILIIEDNPDDEELLMRQLRKARMDKHVQVMHDGAKALAHLTNPRHKCEDLAAIFLDLKLPHVDGLKVLESIRADERLQRLDIIVMTSSNLPEDLERCQELGVSCFVQKPLTFTSFAKAFADTFQARQYAESEHAASINVE